MLCRAGWMAAFKVVASSKQVGSVIMRLINLFGLLTVIAVAAALVLSGGCMTSGWVRGGLIEPDSITYINDIHGVKLVIDPQGDWNLELEDLGSRRQTEYYEVELLRGVNRRSHLNLGLTLVYLQGNIRSAKEYYTSRRIRLGEKQTNETFERVEIGAYPVWRWRYNLADERGKVDRFVHFLFGKQNDMFSLSFWAEPSDFDDAWDDIIRISNSIYLFPGQVMFLPEG